MKAVNWMRWTVIGAVGVGIMGAASFAIAAAGGSDRESSARPEAATQTEPPFGGWTPPAGISDYQAAIVADGEITDAEYEAAVRETVSCMRSQGINAEFLPAPRRGYAPIYRVVSGDEPEVTGERVKPCAEEYLNALQLPYSRELVRRYAAFSNEEAVRRIRECMAERGFPMDALERSTASNPYEEFYATPGAFAASAECQMEMQAERFPQ